MVTAGLHSTVPSCLESIVASCAPSRKIQIPARLFQLRSRPSHAIHQYHDVGCRVFSSTPKTSGALQQKTKKLKQASSISRALHTQHAQQRSIADSLRHDMRRIAHPVAVITSSDTTADSNGGAACWRGATVSSFTTTSMSPTPIVSFNIHEKSTTLQAIQRSDYFAVHLLAQTPEARDMAERFSRGNTPSPFYNEKDGQIRKFVRSGDWLTVSKTSPSVPPNLQWAQKGRSRAVLTTILCQVETGIGTAVGDHVVVFGKVLEILHEPSSNSSADDSNIEQRLGCLIYQNGAYNVSGQSMLDMPDVQANESQGTAA